MILRPRPRTYASTSPLLLLQLHQQQQLLSIINIINSTNHHLHAKLRILLQHLTSHAAYERSGGPPRRPAAKRPILEYIFKRTCMLRPVCFPSLSTGLLAFASRLFAPRTLDHLLCYICLSFQSILPYERA